MREEAQRRSVMRLTAGVCAAALIAAAGVLAYALRDRVGAGAQPDGLLVFATGADWETPKEIAVARPDGSGFQRLTRHAPAASNRAGPRTADGSSSPLDPRSGG